MSNPQTQAEYVAFLYEQICSTERILALLEKQKALAEARLRELKALRTNVLKQSGKDLLEKP